MITRVLGRRHWLAPFGLLAAVTLVGCVTETVRRVDMTPPKQLAGLQHEDLLLDIGITVLDPNIPESYDEQVAELINPDIREAESQFMPYFAKNLLQATGNWGAVRVVPEPTHAVDLIVTGKILKSNGERLIQQFTVTDALGQQWFSRTYEAEASKYAYSPTVPPHIDPFQANYKALANDMLSYREQLSETQIREIRSTAEMQFARDFAPDAFGDHVQPRLEGGFELVRLPAEDDPMLERVRRVREREYAFIDTLDDYYANFHQQMYPPYQQWRAATYEESIALDKLRSQSRNRAMAGAAAIVSGVAGIYESSNPYVDATGLVAIGAGAALVKSAVTKRHEAEMQAEALQEISAAAEAEILPHTMDLENRTLRLTGTVQEQYAELRRILRRVYFEDLGLPEPVDAEVVAEDSI